MSNEPDSDVALMARVRQGDAAAFTELVERYQQPMMNFIARMLGDAAEAEDVCQAVFVQVYRAADRYRPSAKFSTWLYTIARNYCLNELRRRSRHPADSMDAPHPEFEGEAHPQIQDSRHISPPDQVLHRELEHKIEQAIAELPENQRAAILLCRQDELSYEQIAEILGCSLSATKSLIHRGRETLKQKLKPYLKSGHWED